MQLLVGMEKVGALKLDPVILNMIEIWWLYHDGFLWALAMLHDGFNQCNTHTLSPPAFSHSFLCKKSTKKECIPGRSAEPKRLQMSRCAPSFLRPWKGVGGTRALAHLYTYMCVCVYSKCLGFAPNRNDNGQRIVIIINIYIIIIIIINWM